MAHIGSYIKDSWGHVKSNLLGVLLAVYPYAPNSEPQTLNPQPSKP